MRDAELFSLTMGCVQHAKYSQCHRAPNCSAAWGAHYDTIPCSSDLHCAAFGTPRGCALKDSSTVFPEKREMRDERDPSKSRASRDLREPQRAVRRGGGRASLRGAGRE